MKLRTQILFLGLAGALMAAAIGGIGLMASARLGQAIDGVVQSGQALQLSQEADMMHDAIRGDAQQALLGALEKNTERIAEAEKGLKEHSGTFQAALTKLQTMSHAKEAADREDGIQHAIARCDEQVVDLADVLLGVVVDRRAD